MSGAPDPYAAFSSPAGADPYAAISSPTPKARKRGLTESVTGVMANVNRGLGIGDEMAAGVRTAGNLFSGKTPVSDILPDLKRSMATQRGQEDAYSADHPHIAALARGTGNALTMAVPAGPGAAAFATGGRVVNAVRGATVAGLTGAGYAAVDRGSPKERLKAASDASRDPVTLSMGAGAGAIAARGRPRRERPPTLPQLEASRDAAYATVDASGHRYSPESMNALMQDVAQAMDQAGFHAGLHPKASQMVERIGQSQRGAGGYSPTLTELDQLRQQIGRDVAASPDPGERRMGQIMRDQIDGFIAQSGEGSADILRARDLNTRVSKLRSLDNLDEAAADRAAATGSGGNRDNATRQNVIRFQNRTRNLSDAEQGAASRVIHGTPTGNMFRQVGKLSPQGNGLMLAGHLAAAVPTHGASAGVAAVGAVAKLASDAITARNVRALRDLIASGGEAAQEVSRQLSRPEASDLRRQLANDLSVAAGVQGASGASASRGNIFAQPASP